MSSPFVRWEGVIETYMIMCSTDLIRVVVHPRYIAHKPATTWRGLPNDKPLHCTYTVDSSPSLLVHVPGWNQARRPFPKADHLPLPSIVHSILDSPVSDWHLSRTTGIP